MLRFRDIVYIGEANRSAFDEKFAPIINNLHECFLGMRLLHETIADHKASVLTKEMNHNVLSIESVDR